MSTNTNTDIVVVLRYIPCTGSISTVWFSCMKPTMNALFPLYPADFSVEPSTPFMFPSSLYVTDPTPLSMNNASTWIEMMSTQYTTMVHYCDRYGADVGDSSEGDIDWKPGQFVKCANDNLPYDQRHTFCRDNQPWWVLNGRVYSAFTFNDLCPFAGGHSGSQYCFVFSDHPDFPTVSSFLSSNLPGDLSWTSTTFYYVPFTLYALGQVLIDMNVVNTLLTNSMFGSGILITPENYARYGPSVALLSRHMMNLIQADSTAAVDISNMCDDTIPLQPETFERLYRVIQG